MSGVFCQNHISSFADEGACRECDIERAHDEQWQAVCSEWRRKVAALEARIVELEAQLCRKGTALAELLPNGDGTSSHYVHTNEEMTQVKP